MKSAPSRWFAVLLAFLIPPLAFVYLAKLKWALIYLSLSIVFGVFDFLLDQETGWSGFGLLLALTCCVHVYVVAPTVNYVEARAWYSKWWGVLSIPMLITAFVLVFRVYCYEPFHIPSESMMPTLQPGDHIVVSKWGYGTYVALGIAVGQRQAAVATLPERGELYAYFPPGEDQTFVARVIALPGDVVDFTDRQLQINGQVVASSRVERSNIYIETLGGQSYQIQYIRERGINYSGTVPAGEYFLMGDNRDNSLDSRIRGTVPAENFVGKVVWVW